MQELNFPAYPIRITTQANKRFVFDIIRKKHVVLTPEEWVRQHCIWFLIYEKKYPKSLINVEKQVIVNRQKKRIDIIAFNTKGNTLLAVECKAPSVLLSQEAFDQIAKYNLQLNATYLLLTNGLEHYCCQMDHAKQQYSFLNDVPMF